MVSTTLSLILGGGGMILGGGMFKPSLDWINISCSLKVSYRMKYLKNHCKYDKKGPGRSLLGL